MTVPVPATLEITVTAPGAALVNVDAGTLIWVGDTGGGGGTDAFSYDFTVPADDIVLDDGVKITFDTPSDGMFVINLFDVGVIGNPANLFCSVWSRTRGLRYTNWSPFLASGLFAGSALFADDLTITIHGPWNVEWD